MIFDSKKKVKVLFGEWFKNLYSCNVESYENYLTMNPNCSVVELLNNGSSLGFLDELWKAFKQPPFEENARFLSDFCCLLV